MSRDSRYVPLPSRAAIMTASASAMAIKPSGQSSGVGARGENTDFPSVALRLSLLGDSLTLSGLEGDLVPFRFDATLPLGTGGAAVPGGTGIAASHRGKPGRATPSSVAGAMKLSRRTAGPGPATNAIDAVLNEGVWPEVGLPTSD
jgi:hypothetical protein